MRDKAKQKAAARRHYERNKEKMKARANAHRKVRIARAILHIKELKEAASCADCGGQFPSVCMDFDHIRGSKLANVSELAHNGTFQAMLDEIEKCEVVCANCHRIRTFICS